MIISNYIYNKLFVIMVILTGKLIKRLNYAQGSEKILIYHLHKYRKDSIDEQFILAFN